MTIRVAIWQPDEAEGRFEAVLTLHKANRSTLGPLPDSAFRDRAKHNGLLIALDDDRLVGYALYDIPRHNLIKLVHLCVAEPARGAGAARALFNEAIRLNPSRSIITAACRIDYGMDGFWRSLGMHVASEKPGRALNGSILANWIKRINVDSGLDLLEMASLESGLPLAVLDTNIVSDLYSPPTERRDHREETAELEADWLQPLVTFAVSGEVDNEISQVQDSNARRRLREATTQMTRLSTQRPSDRSIEDALLAEVSATALVRDKSLLSDVLQVADAVHAGADYFVTNDANVRTLANYWSSILQGMKIVRPHELIRSLSPESFMSDFRSNLIDGSDLEWHKITEADTGLEPLFRVYDLEPKPADFHRTMRELLAKPKTITLEKLIDHDNRLWALAAFEIVDGVFRIRLLRAIRGERGGTVTFQLLRHFRRLAWANGATEIELADTAVSPTLDSALRADGFGEDFPRAARLGPSTKTATSLGVSRPTDVVLAERRRWPMTVLEAGLPTYLVPIRPTWASRLLGLNDGLFIDRRRGLGLSRELVYFSGSRIVPRPLPARVLWYVSGDKTIQVSQIFARSVMVDAARLTVEEAIERFSHLGVLRKSEISANADKTGKVSVIRFQDTELLQRPLSLRDELFKKYVKGEVQSMRSVAAEFFDEIIERQDIGAPDE